MRKRTVHSKKQRQGEGTYISIANTVEMLMNKGDMQHMVRAVSGEGNELLHMSM